MGGLRDEHTGEHHPHRQHQSARASLHDEAPSQSEFSPCTTQGLGAWESFNADIEGGAGGLQHQPGDYFYGDLRRPFTEIGVWGLQHVLPAGTTSCPIRRVNGDLC